eukprot:XP_011679314.1 PREDICTED: zinc transporter ZIP10-like [Strongylocentrotus purpuratus]
MPMLYIFMLCCIHVWHAEAQLGQGLADADTIQQALCNDLNSTVSNSWAGDCMSELFEKYGEDGKLEYNGFRQLLENMGLGAVRDGLKKPSNQEGNVSQPGSDVNSTAGARAKRKTHNNEHVDHHNTSLEHTSKCLSSDEILDTFKVVPSEGIVPLQFLQLCPILLQQLDSHACIVYDVHLPDDGHNHTDEPSETPFQEPSKIHPGQLLGQAFGIHGHEEDPSTMPTAHPHETLDPEPETSKHVVVWRGCVVLLGIFSFFIFEQTMRMCQKRPKKRLITLVEEPPSQQELSCHSNHSDEESKQSLSEEENQNALGSQEIGEKLCNHSDTAHELIPMMHQGGTDEAKVVNERYSGVFSFKHKSSVIPHTELTDKEKIDEEREEKKSQSSLDLSMKKDQETSYGGVSTSICKDPSLFSVSTPKKVRESDGISSSQDPNDGLQDHERAYRPHSNSDGHHHHHGHSHHGHSHAPGGKMGISAIAWMVVMGDGVHNFTDGLIVGAAFADSLAGGLSTAIAVMCHEIPHELGDFAVMLRGGMSIKQALAFQAVSSILAYMGMAIGLSIGHLSSVSLWVFALAAGAFLYIALTDLFPEMVESMNVTTDNKSCHLLLQVLGALFGVGTMLIIALYEELLIEALA